MNLIQSQLKSVKFPRINAKLSALGLGVSLNQLNYCPLKIVIPSGRQPCGQGRQPLHHGDNHANRGNNHSIMRTTILRGEATIPS